MREAFEMRAATRMRSIWHPGSLMKLAACLLLGAAIGSGGSRSAVLVAVAATAGLVAVLPFRWLLACTAAVTLLFRLVAPHPSGVVGAVPDVLLLLVAIRASARMAFVGDARARRRPVLLVVVPLVGFVTVAVASGILNGGTGMPLLASLRQFLRYPLWGVTVLAARPTWREAKYLLWTVLGVSLLQFPVSAWQYHASGGGSGAGILFHGDLVTGSFGLGGSGELMLFLTTCCIVWLSLALHGAVPAWVFALVVPVLIVPMALGSAASFVVLLPIGVLGLLAVAALRQTTRLRFGHVLLAVCLMAGVAWTAKTFALAPGLDGGPQRSAGALLSNQYLAQYLHVTGEQPSSRLGFLAYAVHVDTHSGWSGALAGQGPSASVIGAPGLEGLKPSLSEFAAESSRSVWSFQRLLLGYGFVALVLFALALVLPSMTAPNRGADTVAQALLVALPTIGVLMAIGGIYSSAWTDPGMSVAYWALMAAAYSGASAGHDRVSEFEEAAE